jgi:hypothetical protein
MNVIITKEKENIGIIGRIKKIFLGDARNPMDQSVFHNM